MLNILLYKKRWHGRTGQLRTEEDGREGKGKEDENNETKIRKRKEIRKEGKEEGKREGRKECRKERRKEGRNKGKI